MRIWLIGLMASALVSVPPVALGQPPPDGPIEKRAPSSPPFPPDPSAPSERPEMWGAIGFTADGSYSTAWKMASKAEAEAAVAKACAKFGRGSCEVVSFPGEMCVGLATYIGSHSRHRYKLSFTAGGSSYPEAQQAALDRCNSDARTRKRCQLRIVVCGDGR